MYPCDHYSCSLDTKMAITLTLFLELVEVG